MFSFQEEVHDSPRKGKPRLPKSQGCMTSNNSSIGSCTTLRLNNAVEDINSTSCGRVVNSTGSVAEEDSPTSTTTTTNRRDIKTSFCIGKVKDYRRMALTLSLSFEKDPFVNYILNTLVIPVSEKARKRKQDLMLAFFEYSVYECFAHNGLVVVLEDTNLELDLAKLNLKQPELSKIPYLGVACWNKLPSSAETSSGFTDPASLYYFNNLHPLSLKFNLYASLARCRNKILKEKFPFLSKTRESVLTNLNLSSQDSVWYLGDIGILPTMQGCGLAKKLINHCLDTYVNTGPNCWCYLESSNLANRKFYEKLGFVIGTTFVINENDRGDLIYMDAMVKYPANHAKKKAAKQSKVMSAKTANTVNT